MLRHNPIPFVVIMCFGRIICAAAPCGSPQLSPPVRAEGERAMAILFVVLCRKQHSIVIHDSEADSVKPANPTEKIPAYSMVGEEVHQ